MTDSERRAEAFTAEVERLGLRDPVTSRERFLARVGIAGLVGGVGLTVAAYFGSHGTTNPLSQRDFIVVALIGVAVTVAGATLFLRYSLANFLRFWLARLIYEQQVQTDRLLEGGSSRES